MIEGPFPVDGHVHFYDCFEPWRFFEAAVANLSAGARAAGVERSGPGCLLLTESAREGAFGALRSGARLPAGWRVEAPETDASAALLRRGGALELIVVGGRQILTAEGIEVLALGVGRTPEDGLPLRATLSDLRAAGAPAVLPWGFGKWLGARGRAIAEVVEAGRVDGLALGDNAGRPAPTPQPRAFRRANARGLPILPGSDPLPLPEAADDAGRYGFVLEGRLDPDRPAADLIDLVARIDAQPRIFGRRHGLAAAIRRQIRLRRRAGAVPPAKA